MIMGFDFWGEEYNKMYYSLLFFTLNPIDPPSGIKLFKGWIDEVNLSNELIEPATNGTYSSTVDSWQDDNVLLAKFEHSLAAGNVGGAYATKPTTHLKIMKRYAKTDGDFDIYNILKFNKKQMVYEFVDKYVEAESEYEYKLQSMNTSYNAENLTNNEKITIDALIRNPNGIYTIYTDGASSDPQSIYVSYYHGHIFDLNNDFHMVYDLELNGSTHHIGGNVIETLGSKYPFVVYQSALDYTTNSIKFILVADNSGTVNKKAEKELRTIFRNFLCDKKPKGLRVEDGTYLAINITGTPQFIPNNHLRGIYEVTFEFAEINDLKEWYTLIEYNLLNSGYNYFAPYLYVKGGKSNG